MSGDTTRIVAPDRERAEHEAGHCAAACALNLTDLQVNFITIHSESSGVCGGTFNLNLEDATIEQWGIIYAAGMAAQLWGIQARNGWGDEDPQTIEAWQTVWPQGIKDRDDFLNRGGTMDQFRECFNIVRRLVRKQWRLIQMLTLELLEYRIIYRDEFRLIVRGYEKDDNDFLSLLDVYRKFRREVEIPGDENFDDFRKNFPEVPWVEGFKDFWDREQPAKGEPLASWYERLMGHAPGADD